MARETIEVPARSVITGHDKDRIRHALQLACRTWVEDADHLDEAAAAGDALGTPHHILDPAAARFIAQGHRQYAEQTGRLLERLDNALFIAFVEEED